MDRSIEKAGTYAENPAVSLAPSLGASTAISPIGYRCEDGPDDF